MPRASSRTVHDRRVHLRVLVTGCGRSGTRYTTFVLRRLGLDVGHERLGRDGIASWSLAVDADHVPWGPSLRALSFDVILHQTRHPLRVVNSVMSFKDESWRFICEHIPCSLEDSLPLRAAAYWYHWNAEAERRADLTFRVENMTCALREICEMLGIEADTSALDRVPTDVNTRRYGRGFHLAEEAIERLRLEPVPWLRAKLAGDRPTDRPPPVGWNEIRMLDPVLCDRMLAMAAGYGYEP